ncbi:MAG: hypothetical protein LBR15_04300 [Methanobrevibacter sp.]|jgi:hypothetical protein|nr:hypothetical protein [Candidatus Methanovirga australis]
MNSKMLIGLIGVGVILFLSTFFILGMMEVLAESQIKGVGMISTPTLEIEQGKTSELDIIIDTNDNCTLKGDIFVNLYKSDSLIGTGKIILKPNQINFNKGKNTIKDVFITGLDNKMTANQINYVINTTDGKTFTSEKISVEIVQKL